MVIDKAHTAGSAKERSVMGTVETKHTGGCNCRCNACDGGHHCHNIGSGCKVKL